MNSLIELEAAKKAVEDAERVYRSMMGCAEHVFKGTNEPKYE